MFTIQLLLDSSDSFLTRERGSVLFQELRESDLFYRQEQVIAEATEAQFESYEITGTSEATVKIHRLAKLYGKLVCLGEIEDFEEQFFNNLKVKSLLEDAFSRQFRIEKSTGKYLKAIVILDAIAVKLDKHDSLTHISPEQAYIQMDNELYDWNSQTNSWQKIF